MRILAVIKMALVTLTITTTFSGCFLMTTKASTPPRDMVAQNQQIKIGIVRMGATQDCYDCDTFSITVRR